MDEEDKKGWKLQNVQLDRKKLAKRLRKAEGATQRHAHRFIVKRIDNARLVARHIVIWFAVVALLVAGLGIQMLWSQQGYMQKSPQAGGLYAEGSLGQISTLNPLFVSTSSEASAAKLLFSSLYDYDETGSLRQDIAKSLVVDETGKKYTIALHDDVKWHDGKPLTAEDVVFTINLIKNPAVRSPLRVNWLDVSVSALSKTSVSFELPAVYAAFPYALTFPVLPKHALKDVAPGAIRENTFSRAPTGSGPFKFYRTQGSDTDPTQRIVHMESNTDYHKGSPKITRFELHAYTTEEALIKAINAGELSGATDVSIAALSSITASQYRSTSLALDSGIYLMLNVQNPILQDAKVRKALQLGTDTTVLRRELGGGVLPLDGPLLNGQLGSADMPHAPVADAQKAKALLDEAGWSVSNGVRMKDGQTLELIITTTQDKEYETLFGMLEKQWKPLGVKVTKNVVDTSNAATSFVQNVLQGRNFDILLYELSIGADPDVYAYWHSSQIGPQGYNFSNYSNALVDANLASARTRLEPELREAKYKQFVRQWIEDVPAIGLYQPVIEYMSNGGATGPRQGTRLVTGADRYANVTDWTAQSAGVYKTP